MISSFAPAPVKAVCISQGMLVQSAAGEAPGAVYR